MLLALVSCGNKTEQSAGVTIPQLQEQLRKDSIALDELQKRYQIPLQTDFHWCDSMLQYLPKESIDPCFDVLNLAQAYLRQFNEMLPIMRQDLAYTQQQLLRLQNDLDTRYINKSLATEYLHDETAVADTLHQRILYFQDRLALQEHELQSLKADMNNLVTP